MQPLVAPFEKTLGEVLFQQQQLGEPIPVPLTLAILRQVCDALDHAHTYRDADGNPMHLLHRDVSPTYIMLSADGVARLVASMAIQANPSYVAPEILLGMTPDARADLFSLGVVAHEMLTGRPLFQGVNEHDTLARVCQLPIPPPSTINPAVSTEVEGVVLMALARDPSYRWQSAALLRDGLASAATRNPLEVGVDPATAWAALFAGQPMPRPQPSPVVPVPSPVPPIAAPAPLAPKAPPVVPELPRPDPPGSHARGRSPTRTNVAGTKTPAPVVSQLPSAPQRPHHNPAARTPAPVVTPSLPSPSEHLFDEGPATTAAAPAFDSRPPAGAFDDSPATVATLAANPFDDAPATLAGRIPNAFDDSPPTIASGLPAFVEPPGADATLNDLPAMRQPPPEAPRPRTPPEPAELPAPQIAKPRRSSEQAELPAPRKQPSNRELPVVRKEPGVDDLPAPRATRTSKAAELFEELPRPRTPSERPPPKDPANALFEDLPAPRPKADPGNPLFEDLPAPRPKQPPPAEDLPAPRPRADPGNPLFEDLPAPRPKADPKHALFEDLPAPRSSKPPAPAPRALSNFDDDDPASAPPSPVAKAHPRASTADIDAFVASVANEQAGGAATGDPEIDAYVASVVGDAAPLDEPAPARPAAYAQLPAPANPFELELGEFTNVGAAPLISFGNSGETPIVVGVGPKAPPRTSAPSLPPPIAVVAANRVEEPDDEPGSKWKLIMIAAGALLVIGGAVVTFLLLVD